MNAKQAVDWVDPFKWKHIPAQEKLDFLNEIRMNLKEHMEELAHSDNRVKNIPIPTDDKRYLYQAGFGYQATTLPMATIISACIRLYKSLAEGKMLKPLCINKVGDDLYDVHVFPQSAKDKVMYADRKDYLRIKGEPRQVNPLKKEGGIIAVLGAGNYSSSIEMIKALFLENCVVVHKPHPLNQETDKVWAKVMKPLVDFKALSFCEAQEGKDLVKDEYLTKIYFTGGSATAKKIMASTKTPLISECGGNNPCIIVPGAKPWTHKQINHQAIQIATMAKLNGGAVCGRPQTIVTSKNWPQRDDFLKELQTALEDETPAATSYYPGSEEVFAAFKENHPNAKVLKPEGDAFPNSKILFIEDVAQDSYAVKNEAFCQAVDEVALDTLADAESFLEEAVEFSNTKLHGTLGSSILIDDQTADNHRQALEKAVTDMEYGGIGVNTMPPMIFLNPYLTWGGNEEGKELVSGSGNFGNLLCYENIEKSISYSDFMSTGHMASTNKKTWFSLSKAAAKYAIDPSWRRLGIMTMVMLTGKLKHKDF
jgi:acyl-CoA reductase-like NAD-dependent aldehyde dehydrogenase